jgi:hypothetical protein
MAATHSVQKLMTMAGKFILEHEGLWDHDAWEKLIEDAAKLGMSLDTEDKRNLGNILEAGKYFFHRLPASPPKKKAAAKPKAKVKAKAKEKNKS